MGALSERLVERRQSSEAESPRFRFSGVVQLGQIMQMVTLVGALAGGSYWLGGRFEGYDAKFTAASVKMADAETKITQLEATQRALSTYDGKLLVHDQRFAADEASIASIKNDLNDFQREIRQKLDRTIEILERLPRQAGK